MSSRRGWHKPDKFKQERVRLSVTLEQHVPIESEILRYLSHVHSSDISRVVRAIFILGFRQHCKEQGLDISNQDHYQSQVLNGVAEIPLQHLMRKPSFEVELSSPIVEKKSSFDNDTFERLKVFEPIKVDEIEKPFEEVYATDDIEYVHHEAPVEERKIQQSHQPASTPKPQSNNGRSSFLNRSSDYWNEAQQANQVEDKKVQVPVYQNLDHGAL